MRNYQEQAKVHLKKMVDGKLKEIEKKLERIEKKLKKNIPIPKDFGEAFKEGTDEIIRILDQTIKESIPGYQGKKTKADFKKGLKVKLFDKKVKKKDG